MQTTFIVLLCEHQPDEVYNYLLQNDGKLELDIEHIMQVCQKHRIIDAQTFLLEKTNQISQAMKLLLVSLTTKMQKMRKDVISSSSRDDLTMNTFADVKRFVDVGVQLCVRNYQHLDEKESHNVWFSLLDRFVKPRQSLSTRLKCEIGPCSGEEDFTVWNDIEADVAPVAQPKTISQGAREVYKTLMRLHSQYMKYILTFMLKHLPPASIWGKIQRDHPTDTYGEFRSILSDIMEHFTYSLAAHLCCYRIMKNDTYKLGESLRKIYTRPIGNSSEADLCSMCEGSLAGKEGADSLRYYSCGHLFHDFCCPYARCSVCSSENKRVTSGAERPQKPTKGTESQAPKELDEKAIKRIITRLDRIRKQLKVSTFLDTDALCDDKISLAATMKYQGKSTVSLLLAPMMIHRPYVLLEGLPNKLPKVSVKTTVMNEEEILEIFGDEIVESIRSKKEDRDKKKQIEEKKKKILSGNVAWDEDDADALAWDS
jgi:hypothetical protein